MIRGQRQTRDDRLRLRAATATLAAASTANGEERIEASSSSESEFMSEADVEGASSHNPTVAEARDLQRIDDLIDHDPWRREALVRTAPETRVPRFLSLDEDGIDRMILHTQPTLPLLGNAEPTRPRDVITWPLHNTQDFYTKLALRSLQESNSDEPACVLIYAPNISQLTHFAEELSTLWLQHEWNDG